MVFEKGLFYYSDTNKSRIKRACENLENDFETKEDFIRAVNSLLHSNGLLYSKLRTISNETEFINYIQSQYNLYNEYTSNNSLNWLNFTKKAIMYGFGILSIENESLKASFMNWYTQTIKSITPEKPKLMESNIFDKIVKELDLIKDVFYSQIENRNDNWNQKDEGRPAAINLATKSSYKLKFEVIIASTRSIPSIVLIASSSPACALANVANHSCSQMHGDERV